MCLWESKNRSLLLCPVNKQRDLKYLEFWHELSPAPCCNKQRASENRRASVMHCWPPMCADPCRHIMFTCFKNRSNILKNPYRTFIDKCKPECKQRLHSWLETVENPFTAPRKCSYQHTGNTMSGLFIVPFTVIMNSLTRGHCIPF